MVLSYSRIPSNKSRNKEGNIRLLLGKDYSNNCCRKDPLMDAKSNG